MQNIDENIEPLLLKLRFMRAHNVTSFGQIDTKSRHKSERLQPAMFGFSHVTFPWIFLGKLEAAAALLLLALMIIGAFR